MAPSRGSTRALIEEANQLRATRKRDVRAALKGIDSALKALELYAKVSGQLQGPQHNHLHLHGQAVPTREEAVEIACETLACFAPHLLAASPTHQPECEMQSRVRENS